MTKTTQRTRAIAYGVATVMIMPLIPSASGSNSAKSERSVSQAFETGPAPRVTVETFNGSIDVTGTEAAGVEATVIKQGMGPSEAVVQASLANIEVSMTGDGNTIRVVARLKNPSLAGHPQAAVQIKVPSHATLQLETGNGPITTSNIGRAIIAKSRNGKIHVRGSQGANIDVTTINGNINILNSSDVIVSSARTSNGTIQFSGTLSAGGHVFRNINGDIELTLSTAAAFSIDAESGNGMVTSNFDIHRTSGRRRGRLVGAVGDHSDTTITARTSNGEIRINRGGNPD